MWYLQQEGGQTAQIPGWHQRRRARARAFRGPHQLNCWLSIFPRSSRSVSALSAESSLRMEPPLTTWLEAIAVRVQVLVPS